MFLLDGEFYKDSSEVCFVYVLFLVLRIMFVLVIIYWLSDWWIECLNEWNDRELRFVGEYEVLKCRAL